MLAKTEPLGRGRLQHDFQRGGTSTAEERKAGTQDGLRDAGRWGSEKGNQSSPAAQEEGRWGLPQEKKVTLRGKPKLVCEKIGRVRLETPPPREGQISVRRPGHGERGEEGEGGNSSLVTLMLRHLSYWERHSNPGKASSLWVVCRV